MPSNTLAPPAGAPVRYHLRATLTPEHHAREEAALSAFIREARIDEVLFFVPHAEERSTGLGTDEENARMAAILAPVFEQLRHEGIAPSINIWWTVSFSNFPGQPRDLRDRFSFRWAVGVDGNESRAVACPRCPAWRAQVARMYQTYAALRPVRLWIDDDVRMTSRADLHSPCFCAECLREMGERTGTPWTPQTLVAGIMADGPNPVRDAWLDYQRTLELDVVSELADSVHEVSPGTRVSLMHSGPEYHSAEGRRWPELIEALGLPTPTLRPGIGPYIDTQAPGIVEGLNYARLAQAAVPPGTHLAPEVENYPHSRFFKSTALVRANLEISQLLGIQEMTFSILRFGGRMDLELARDNAWGPLLRGIKPRLQAIADLNIRPEQARGLSLYWHEQAARHARDVADQPKPIFTFRQRPWDRTLPLFGIATRYGTGSVTAFAGEDIACLDDAELEDVFRRGVLLDARAAETLRLRGRGDLCGISGRLANAHAAMETIEDPDIAGPVGDVINGRWTSTAWQFDWMDGARVVSRLRSHSNEDRGHGVTLFENPLGGRVVVVPFDSQAPATVGLGIAFPALESPSFICAVRQAQLVASLQWANRMPLPLTVPDAPCAYALRIDQESRLILSVTNLSPEPIRSLVLRLPQPSAPLSRLHVLEPSGEWRTLDAVAFDQPAPDTLDIRPGLSLAYLETQVILVEQ